MNRKLTSEQIEAAYRDLLTNHGRVTVRGLMVELRRRHGACGRTKRVSDIIGQLQVDAISPSLGTQPAADTPALLERLRAAEARAERSEEIERRHQDYWAKRYAEKVDELERRHATALGARPAINIDQHLRLQQRIADLALRLSKYEPVEA